MRRWPTNFHTAQDELHVHASPGEHSTGSIHKSYTPIAGDTSPPPIEREHKPSIAVQGPERIRTDDGEDDSDFEATAGLVAMQEELERERIGESRLTTAQSRPVSRQVLYNPGLQLPSRLPQLKYGTEIDGRIPQSFTVAQSESHDTRDSLQPYQARALGQYLRSHHLLEDNSGKSEPSGWASKTSPETGLTRASTGQIKLEMLIRHRSSNIEVGPESSGRGFISRYMRKRGAQDRPISNITEKVSPQR
jgi:hypothetical protein